MNSLRVGRWVNVDLLFLLLLFLLVCCCFNFIVVVIVNIDPIIKTNAMTNIHRHIMHWRQFIYCMDSSFFYCMLSVTCLMIARFYAQHNPHCRPILILYLVQPHKHKLHPTSPRKSLLIMQIFSATRSKYPKMFVRPLRACSSVFELWSWSVSLRH